MYIYVVFYKILKKSNNIILTSNDSMCLSCMPSWSLLISTCT